MTAKLSRSACLVQRLFGKSVKWFKVRGLEEMETLLVLATFALFTICYPLVVQAEDDVVLGDSFKPSSVYVSLINEPVTVSRFSEKEDVVRESIPFETKYEEDDELSWGKEEVLQEGAEGQRISRYKVTLWYGEETNRELLAVETIDPQPKIIKRGTKIEWKEVPGKGYKYWAKLENCWTTSYDGNCVGCRGLTYSGTKVKQGVCAVDPAVIPLGTNFYVPGYGICRAEDIGGAIDGNDIDLGFEDVRKGFWSARHVDVYLLTNAPE